MLAPRQTDGSSVTSTGEGCWRLEIPAGPAGGYRLAQLDDYASLPRQEFPWHPPLHLHLKARASQAMIPGTWGFGLWNDPFSLSLGFGGSRRFPALPEAAWFFFASPPNYLSLRDDLPAQGGLAATFQSKSMPPPLLAWGALGLPLLVIPPLARLLRRLGRRFVKQDAIALPVDSVEWHSYRMDWAADRVVFGVDEGIVWETRTSPAPPLALVIWVDNQYASWAPDGRLKLGTLANPEPAWIEVDQLTLLDNRLATR
jgi:hypothetical protein